MQTAVRTELPRQRLVRLRRKLRPQGLKKRTELKLCPYGLHRRGAACEHFFPPAGD